VYKTVVGKPSVKRQLGVSRRGWEYNIKKGFTQMIYSGFNFDSTVSAKAQW
jgi:hypothetical protein